MTGTDEQTSDERLNGYARRLSPDARRILAGDAAPDAVTVAALQRGGLLDDALQPTADGRAVLAIVRIHEVARLIAENDGLDRPLAQASRVYVHVVAPLLWLLAEARYLEPKTDCGRTNTHPAHSFRETPDAAAFWCSGVLHQPPTVEAELARRRREVEFEANAIDLGADNPPDGHMPIGGEGYSKWCECGEVIYDAAGWFDHWAKFLICACPNAEEFDALAAAGFAPIRCAVHRAGPEWAHDVEVVP